MNEVGVGLNFIQEGTNLAKIKKELQEIAKIASTQVRFGAFDKNAFGEIKAEINKVASQMSNAFESKGKSQILRDIKAWENELRLGNISLKEMSFLYKDAIAKLENMKNAHKEISSLRVRDNELLNRSADIMKNVSAQAKILKNNLSSGLIDNSQFSVGMNKLLTTLDNSNINKSDVLYSSIQKDILATAEKQGIQDAKIANSKIKQQEDLLNELIKLEAQYKNLKVEADKFNSVAVKSAQKNVESKLDDMTLSSKDIDLYEKAINDAKLLSEAKIRSQVNYQMELDKTNKKESDSIKRSMQEEAEATRKKIALDEEETRKKKIESDKRQKIQDRELANRGRDEQEYVANLKDILGTASLAIGYGLMNNIKALLPLEKQMYDLGVIANVSSGQIEELRTRVFSMASTMPFASAEIAKALNEVARTGKSLEESFAIVDKSGKLAISSGEDLLNTTNIVVKAITAFGIKGTEMGDVLDKLHSVVATTPLSLESLGDALKNSAGKIVALHNRNIMSKVA